MADDFLKDAARVAGRGALSGLGAVGNLLDLPGSMIRDTLALKNPLDQLLSPFGDENRTTGRDLARQYGLAGEKDTWGNWGGGLAVEVATDPLTYLGLPGLSKAATTAGKVASKAGVVTDDIVRVATKKAGQAVKDTKTLGMRAKMTTTARDLLDDLTPSQIDPIGLNDIGSHTPVSKQRQGLKQALDVAAKSEGRNLDNLLDQPLGGLTEWGIPFTKKSGVLGTADSPLALKAADTLDNVYDAARYNPLSNAIAPLFSKSVRGGLNKADQIEGVRATANIDRANRAGRSAAYNLLDEIEKSGVLNDERLYKEARDTQLGQIKAANPGMDSAGLSKLLDAAVPSTYGRDTRNTHANKIRDYLEEVNNWGELKNDPKMAGILPQLDNAKKMMVDSLAAENAAGLVSNELTDQISGTAKYFPRGKRFIDNPNKTFFDKLRGKEMAFDTSNPYTKQRDSGLTGMIGGTSVLNQMSVDPAISGFRSTMATAGDIPKDVIEKNAKHILDTYPGAKLNHNPEKLLMDLRQSLGMEPTPDQLAKYAEDLDVKHAYGLARYMAELPAEHAKDAIPMFNLNPVDDLLRRVERGNETTGSMKQIYSIIKDVARNVSDSKPDDVKLGDLFNQEGMDRHKAAKAFGEILGSKADPDELLKNTYVPKEEADTVGRMISAFKSTEAVGPWLNAYDRTTRLFKAGVTSPYPSFNARNRVGGAFQKFMGKMGDAREKGPMAYLRPANDAETLMTGEVVKGAAELPIMQAQGITDDVAATEAVRKLAAEHGVIGGQQGMALENSSDAIGDFASSIPGMRPDGMDFRTIPKAWKSVKGVLHDYKPKNLADINPLNVAGVGANADIFTPVKAGRKVSAHGEGVNRLSGFYGLLTQGVDPAEAARRVNKYDFDYGNLSKFEQKVMRRLFPFYSFSKGSATQVVDDLLTKPGGRLRQTMRLTDSLKGDDPTTPDYVADTLAIPLGQQEDGTKRYITGFGLAHEDPVSFLGGGIRGAGLEVASRLNPIIKGPIEYTTGQSFFQKGPQGGRSLSDADPTLGRLLANVTGQSKAVRYPGDQLVEVALANSPAARVVSTARQLTDTRKGVGTKAVNFLTGARVSDISPGAQDAVLRDKLTALIQSQPESRQYTKTFISKEELAQMTPRRRKELEAMLTLGNELADRASTRAKAKKRTLEQMMNVTTNR